MGQGNAIAHLMPPPFYAYRYVVAKARAPEESIQDQINSIVDAGPSKRYKIEVMPSAYEERYEETAIGIQMKEYVDVVAPYGRAVIRPGNAVTTAVNMADHCMLQGLQVDMQSMGAEAIGVSFAAAVDDSILEDVWVTGGGADDIGVLDATTGVTVIVRKCRIDGTVATGYKKTGTGSTWFADNRVTATSIDIDVDAGTLNLLDNELMGTVTNVDAAGTCIIDSHNNTLNGNGWKLDDSANIKILSHDDVFSLVEFVGTHGLFADLTGARLYDCEDGVLAIGDWVYCDSSDHVAKADSDDIGKLPSIGRVAYLPTDTTCYVKNYGYAYEADPDPDWTAGEEYWIDGGANAGEITTTMPPVWPQRAGVAVSDQRFKILVGDNLGLVHCNEYQCAHGAVTVNQWVYITTTEPGNEVGPTDASAAATMGGIGVCVQVTVGEPNDTVLIKLRGKYIPTVYPADAWAPSDDVYISDATAGAITKTMPVGGIIQKVAEVKYDSDPTLIYEIAD